MKYATKLIIDDINLSILKNREESLFLINGFEDIAIYVKICEELTDIANDNGKSINIKMAKNKWNYFKKNYQGSPCLHKMEQNEWISEEESTTYYRNQHNEDILILLGTEEEEDISGSLRDIYEIRCDRLFELLPKSNGKIIYSDMIEYLGINFNKQEKMAIDKLYRDLFELVTPDICKLSSFWDENITSITTINDFIRVFFNSLPIWNIPKRVDNLPTMGQINNRNLLKNQFNFINGIPFNPFTPTMYKKFETKIERYNDENHKYSSNWAGWNNQKIGSYDNFKETILSFIKGNRSQKIKNELLDLDYSIVEDILGLKISSNKQTKKSVEKLYGNPLKVFSTVFLNTLVHIFKNNINTDYVTICFTDASILTATSDKNMDLVDSWKNICIHTSGVIEQISNYKFTLSNKIILLKYEPYNYFDINAELDNSIHSAGTNKKMNKISFKITYHDLNGKKFEEEYTWIFSSNEEWLNNFTDLCRSKFVMTPNNACIPLATMKNLDFLISKRSKEEFFDYLIEKSNIDFKYNILKQCENILLSTNKSKYFLFKDLGEKFVKFCNKIRLNGIYNALLDKDNNSDEFINSYKNLGNSILSSSFPENEQYILDLFIHSFNIEKDNKSIENENDIDCCIVPPWHPASIEKIKHSISFFLKGCNEFLQAMMNSNDMEKVSYNMIKSELSELEQLTLFQSSVDLFPIGASFLGVTTSYGNYSLYAKNNLKLDNNLRDLVKKEVVFDDEFKNNSYSTMNEDSKMIYGIIESYIKAFPNNKDKLSLVFIDPSDLQPIIAAVHHYIQKYQKENGLEKELYINLKILVRPENKGGKNYITYWMNENFDLDSNIKIKTFLNEWRNKTELDKLLNANNDIIFAMDILKINDYEFINKVDYKSPTNECYYPIVFRPSPISNTSTRKRRIELTQPQFESSMIHTQVVHYKKNLENQNNGSYYAVKTVNIDLEIQDIILRLHDKSYWVVCIDSSIDGKLLNDCNNSNEYSVIGFSTGKGRCGQYNITITARNSILKSIEKNFSKRLSRMFKWEKELVKKASIICMKEATILDGISILTASNQKDYNINEFMAYVLTSLRTKTIESNSPLRIIIHLDSYKHWFNGNYSVENSFDNYTNKSRPDFLILSINNDFNKKLKIKATVIECKIARYENKIEHIKKAVKQVEHGKDVLSKIFNPKSNSIKRKYWYAQLYRALTFAQISFNNDSHEFKELSNRLRRILNGDFEIEWDGYILGYWLDMDGDDEIKDTVDNIDIYNIPQKRIQRLLLGNDQYVEYVDFDFTLLSDEEEYKEISKQQESTIDEIFKNRKERRIEKVKEKKNEFIRDERTSYINTELENIDINEKTINDINKKNVNVKSKISTETRVLIGRDKLGKDIYWEFGHKQLANRHLLITGTSGQGKTYCIQAMLYELSKNNIPSIIFDYTEGFTRNQLEPEFVEEVGDKINEYIMYYSGVPINPFKRHEIEVSGKIFREKDVDVATRLANVFKHVYDFGDQQFSAIFNAVRIGMKKYGDSMDIKHFYEELENIKNSNSAAKTVISKMEPFFYSVEFVNDSDFDWDTILYTTNAKINIFQLTRIDRQMQVIITELMLWDAWYYTQKVGNKDRPFVVVLDEAQNLSHKHNAPSAKILTEGRKFGWSSWFATQSLKVLDNDEIIRLMQAAVKLYFKPTDDELKSIAKLIDPVNSNVWLSPIKNLTKGQCIMIGDRIRNDGTFGNSEPISVSVESFKRREQE